MDALSQTTARFIELERLKPRAIRPLTFITVFHRFAIRLRYAFTLCSRSPRRAASLETVSTEIAEPRGAGINMYNVEKHRWNRENWKQR